MIPPLTPRTFGRFSAKVSVAPSGCLLWRGGIDPTGYGRFHAGPGRMAYAHRVSFEWAKGPIPAGLDVDHLCRNRACVNPAHLEAVTRRENLLRGATLTAAHARGVHCGNARCRSCRNKAA